ncbi:MAG: hypothetical protein U0900_19840 [Myxococcota bacterium]
MIAFACAALAGGRAFAVDAPVAEVASVMGTVDATDAQGQVRALEIGDPIYAGDTVRTSAGATVGLWHDEALTQLSEKSRATVDVNADGDPRVTLVEGAVRVVDPRKTGEPIEIVALDSSSSVLGGDREARILREKAGAYSMICDWVKPVAVKRRAEGKTAVPGDCVIANPREPMFAAPGHSDRIPLLAGAPNLADAGPGIDPARLIQPLPPVGAPGPDMIGTGLASNGGPGSGPASRVLSYQSPCATIGIACSGGNVGVVEPPPTGDPFPGSGGFPGGGDGFPGGGVVP